MNDSLKQRVIETSLDLFKEQGFDTVKVTQICDACEITKPTFYRFFSSKGDLLESYYQSILDDMLNVWDQSDYYHGYWSPVVCTMSYLLTMLTSQGVDLIRQLIIHGMGTSKDLFLNSEHMFEKLNEVVVKAQSKGDIASEYPSTLITQTLINTMIGYLIRWTIYDGKIDLLSDFIAAIESFCKPVNWGTEDE